MPKGAPGCCRPASDLWMWRAELFDRLKAFYEANKERRSIEPWHKGARQPSVAGRTGPCTHACTHAWLPSQTGYPRGRLPHPLRSRSIIARCLLTAVLPVAGAKQINYHEVRTTMVYLDGPTQNVVARVLQ
jgi:hypothetical protein